MTPRADLMDRAEQAFARAVELQRNSLYLIDTARQLRTAGSTIRTRPNLPPATLGDEERSLGDVPLWAGQHSSMSFRLEGNVDGDPVEATFENGALVCSPKLWVHAELVVAMGDMVPAGHGVSAAATLDGPPALMLVTLMRAMKVTSLRAVAVS